MLNGQLPLAALYFSRMWFARLSRPGFWAAGVGGLGLIAGCTTTPTTRAPIVDLSKPPAASSPAAAGSTYVVKPGDTLYQIARNHGVSMDDLRQWNNISDANQLNVGQGLKLSSGSVAGGLVATAPSSSSGTVVTPMPLGEPGELGSDTMPSEAFSGTTPPADTTTTPPAATSMPAASTSRAADANLISWGWPASGPVAQTFTPASKGIDISGALGASVVAAADGKVMYSGNGVRGLGNLIIVNHENGFITAYAHNRTLLVETGEAVKRGAKIAEIGQSDTTSPRLHFEIRRQGTPVDPLQYLPVR